MLAVLGDDATDEILARVGAEPRDLAPAAAAHVVRRDEPRWRFRHELLRGVACELVPPGRRVELEIAAAAALEEIGASAASIAGHRLAVAEVDPAGAARAALHAAMQATDDQAFAEAIEWTERGRVALRTAGSESHHLAVRLAVIRAEAGRLAGAPDHAGELIAAAEQALQLDDAELRRDAVLATLRLGACCQPGPEQARAVEFADRALALEPDPSNRAMLHAAASLTHSMVDPVASRDHYRQADQLVAALDPTADADVLTQVLPYAYMGFALPSDLDARAAAAERLAAAAAACQDPSAAFEAHHLQFSSALQRGDRAGCDVAHAAMVELAPRVADAGRRWSLAYQHAALCQLDGDLEGAEAAAEEALQIGTTVAPIRAAATWAAQLLEIRRLQGRLAELEPVIDGLVADPAALPAWRSAGALVLADSRPAAARQLVDDVMSALADFPQDFARGAGLLTLARAVLTLELSQHAGPLLAELRPWAHLLSWQGTTTYGPYGEVVAALGVLEGDDEAVADGRAGADSVTRRLGSPVYSAA